MGTNVRIKVKSPFCRECGKRIRGEAVACERCGLPLHPACAESVSVSRTPLRFLRHTKPRVRTLCPSCSEKEFFEDVNSEDFGFDEG